MPRKADLAPGSSTYSHFSCGRPHSPTHAFPLTLRLLELYPHSPRRNQHNITPQPRKLLLPTLHRLIRLQNPRHHVRHLRQRELLPDADARAAVERDVLFGFCQWRRRGGCERERKGTYRPGSRCPLLPPVGGEVEVVGEGGGGWGVDFGAALEDLGEVSQRSAGRDAVVSVVL